MKTRNLNIDLLKCVALFFVICVHFFMYTDYYGKPFSMNSIFYSSFFWFVFMSCVPLFILISGYLMKDKEYSKKYFLKLLPVVGIYIGASFIYTFYGIKNIDIDFFIEAFKNILSFSHYSWYVNMYIGLYLIMPVLNAGYRYLKQNNYQTVFIFIIILLTCVNAPLSMVSGKYPELSWMGNVIPNYWQGIWPVTYYLLGIYIGDRLSSIKHQASSIKHQASSIKHQASSIKHQASSNYSNCYC